jgi:hypothetical protein
MAVVYAYVDDIIRLGRKLTSEEQEKADTLLPIASAKLRIAAKKYGRDIDKMICENSDIAFVVKEIVVKSVIRAIDSSSNSAPPAAQESQSAMGYSVSMTYLNAGQSLYFLKNELKELGIIRQRYGVLEVYENADEN